MFSNEKEDLERCANELNAAWVVGDQRDDADVARLVETAVSSFGTVDILVLNGGGPGHGPAASVRDDELVEGASLVLLSAVRLVRHCLPYLAKGGYGRILAILSTSVFEPIDDLVLSNVYRPAVLGFLKTLSREVGGSGVTVNAIAPGRISTRTFEEFYEHRSREADLAEIPVGRFGGPEEVGDLAAFLASGRAAYVTGTIIPIDGGLTRSLT